MEHTENIRTEHVQVESSDQFIGLFGIREENLPLFKDELGVELFTHGGEITISGAPEKVELAKLTLEKLTEILPKAESADTAQDPAVTV